jgi:hypothetical protein
MLAVSVAIGHACGAMRPTINPLSPAAMADQLVFCCE